MNFHDDLIDAAITEVRKLIACVDKDPDNRDAFDKGWVAASEQMLETLEDMRGWDL